MGSVQPSEPLPGLDLHANASSQKELHEISANKDNVHVSAGAAAGLVAEKSRGAFDAENAPSAPELQRTANGFYADSDADSENRRHVSREAKYDDRSDDEFRSTKRFKERNESNFSPRDDDFRQGQYSDEYPPRDRLHQNGTFGSQSDSHCDQSGQPLPQGHQHPSGRTGQKKLFVGQLPRSFEVPDIRAIFEPFGQVSDVFILRDNGISKGCAFVTFAKDTEADAAMDALHQTYRAEGMHNPLQVSVALRPNAKLFVARLTDTFTDQDMAALFERFGPIIESRVVKDNGRCKGFGFVEFEDYMDAKRAAKAIDGKRIQGRNIVVKFSENKKKDTAKRGYSGFGQLPNQGASSRNEFGYANMNGYIDPYDYGHLSHGSSYGGPAAQPNYMHGFYPSPYAPASGPDHHQFQQKSQPTHGSTYYPHAGSSASHPSYARPSSATQNPGHVSASQVPQQSYEASTNLFVYNFPSSYNDLDLSLMFARFGSVQSAKVFIDKVTGRSKCFGFVSFENVAVASRAIDEMNGSLFEGKRLKVAWSTGKRGRD